VALLFLHESASLESEAPPECLVGAALLLQGRTTGFHLSLLFLQLVKFTVALGRLFRLCGLGASLLEGLNLLGQGLLLLAQFSFEFEVTQDLLKRILSVLFELLALG